MSAELICRDDSSVFNIRCTCNNYLISSYHGAESLVLQHSAHDDVGEFQPASCLDCGELYSIFNVPKGVIFIEEEE